MANQKNIETKAQLVAGIKEKVEKAKSVVIFDYRGITVEQDTAMRKQLREAGIDYMVLKNDLVKRAAESLGVDSSIEEHLKGPSAFAFGYEDAVAPAKILKQSVKKFNIKCTIKGGIVEGTVYDSDAMNTLADLPGREVLIARLLGSMMSPISGLAIVLDQLAKKSGETAEAAE